MKTTRISYKFIAVIALFALVLSLASCGLFDIGGGSLELVSFTVDKTTIKTNYLVGEAIDFSGIKAIARYSDESLNAVYTFDDLTITYDEDITATPGEKDVKVSFDDPHLNIKQEFIVKIKVSENVNVDETDPLIVTQFEQPSSLTAFNGANSSAGSLEYGNAAFAGVFANGDAIYVIGNENAFKLNPKLSALNSDDEVVALEKFYANVVISVLVDGEYVALTQTAGEENSVSYHNGETLIATVDTYNGEYFFSSDAEGLEIKISILPSEEYYIYDGNAVVLEAKIVKAYNVYEAAELSIIDNYNAEWNEFKGAHGLNGITASGIVLHNNIKLTAEDAPASFFLTTENDIVYTNSVTGETITIPAGTKYLNDGTNVYERVGTSDFKIHGNFFTLDSSTFPLVPSPGVFGKDSGYDYGSDFSNATLIRFSAAASYVKEKPEFVPHITIDNISVIGNAKRDNLIDSTESLASAGGLIFLKSSHHAETTINNVIGNSYFITYFADYGGDIEATAVKCYDSYQNAAMVWGSSVLKFTDSYLNGCGGPVIIAQSVVDDNEHPILEVINSKAETHVTGQEIWFTAINANTIISQITALGNGLGAAGLGNFVDSEGKMNIKGLLMHDGTDAAVVIGGVDAQGSMSFDGKGIDRTQSAENVNWGYILQISKYAQTAGSQLPPFFTVNANGTAYSMYYNGSTFVDFTGATITPATHAELCMAFMSADTITLTQGGISVAFDFYH